MLVHAIRGVQPNFEAAQVNILATSDNHIIVGIQSSIIRGGIKDGSNNLDIMKIFDGVSEDLSNIQVGTINGEELVGLIVKKLHRIRRYKLPIESDSKNTRATYSVIFERQKKRVGLTPRNRLFLI